MRGRRLDLPAWQVVRERNLWVTSPARTWIDCAQHIPVAHVLAMGDVILRRDLASAEDLARLVHRGVRRRGNRSARRALPHLDPRAESPGESLARHALLSHGVPRPECGYGIIVDGEWLARADMAWPRARLIVEYDGLVHITEEQRRKDAARRNILQDVGWTLIVFTAADLKHPESMAALVQAALHRANPSASGHLSR